jgi:hypothetical protein
MNRDSSATTVTGFGLDKQDSISERAVDLFLRHRLEVDPAAPSPLPSGDRDSAAGT